MTTTVGIVGINGLVGQTVRKLLSKVQNIEIKEFARKDTLTEMDIAILCTDNADSVLLVDQLKDKVKFIIDMSSEFRMREDVPLVIPEINPDDITKDTRLIASPNCTITGPAMALAAVRSKYTPEEMFIASYQALSGGGKKLVEEANNEGSVYYKNAVPKIGSVTESGFTSEELKSIYEARKMFHMPELVVYPHTVRIFVDNGHSIAVSVKFKEDVNLEEIKEMMSSFPGLIYGDNIFTAKEVSGKNEVFVCRMRADLFNKKMLHFFVVNDNILKGAALNGVQIAELIIKKGLCQAK
ncbi:aspartate-semialdehyde dehydrogenase [Parelusimicrobium proximum]|uniref:aspartate-semialdehyde dehydrogenase n=1 Tax=Parelusimicrobium proximum TaxID=3228953 RepID=UPI003D168B12